MAPFHHLQNSESSGESPSKPPMLMEPTLSPPTLPIWSRSDMATSPWMSFLPGTHLAQMNHPFSLVHSSTFLLAS